MPNTPIIGELYKLKHVTDQQIDAAIRDYLNDPMPGMRPIRLSRLIAVSSSAPFHS
ncbi:hypothetical protein [Methylobacterium nodulans]|uniref:Uncharacterized protein n=1 Tax=Methylobacterium nodulans (strain LMG 21967 / CNCM I-2342 / ORS 2060) TaxID=460265 RepID=B8IX15_METNO|nr:hypothetical protein [Methylobacterium nodulans]ACL63056.1 conserved hypothetical protein [Methylobacterium nodulans ORS 2060]